MKPATAFDTFQTVVNAKLVHVTKARSRRNVFCDAFDGLDDVLETLPSGSLARGTQRDPIHDVDLIMVYDADAHEDWDTGNGSAEAALEHVREDVHRLLGASRGSYGKKVRRADLRNHVVKCFLDDPNSKNAFAVEVMPALRVEGGLRVPERLADRWVTVNPEYLIGEVARRHEAWNKFAPMVRVLKSWKDTAGLDMKSLVAEVLALQCIPEVAEGQGLRRQDALATFFTKASVHVMNGVYDPAGLCGEIQPSLDRSAVRAKLQESADTAARAVAAEERGADDVAVCLWRSIFGADFPQPPGGCANAGLPTTAPGIAAPLFVPPRIQDAPQG